MSQRTQIWNWALPMSDLLRVQSNGQLAYRQTINDPFISLIQDYGRRISVLDYGAIGDGVADDTAAFQAALDVYSRIADADGNSGGGGSSGILYVPAGTYNISSTLNYYGNYSFALYLLGELRDPNSVGSVLKWTGAAGGTMLKMHGASLSVVRDMSFDGSSNAARLIKVQPWKNNANVLVTGGTHCAFERLHLSQIEASGECLSFGDESADANTYQCDQMEINYCTFAGYVAGKATETAGTAIKVYDGGNTKNFRVRGGVATHLDCIVDWAYSSGALWVESVMAAEIAEDCFIVGGGGAATIVGCAIEGGPYDTRFLTGTPGTNGARATLIGNSVVLSAPDDDGVVFWRGNLTLLNNEFINDRVPGTSVAKILIDATAANGAVTAIGNHFDNLTVGEFPPIYDTGGNNLVGIDPVNSYAQQASVQCSVVALNNTGGDWNAGALVKLRDVFGRAPAVTCAQPALIPTTVTKGAQGELNIGRTKLTIPYTSVQTAGLTNTIQVLTFIPKTRIKSLVMDPSTVFAGTAGAVTAKIGSTSGGDEYMLSATVSAGGAVKGLADGDLGTLLVRANVVQGGYVPSWAGAGGLYVTFTSASGNLSGLTAGALDIYLELEAI